MKEKVIKIVWSNNKYQVGINVFMDKDTNLLLNGIYEDENGTIRYFKNGKFHNENGPAYITTDGQVVYYINGELHRIDGPAAILSNGYHNWYINGYQIEAEIINTWLKENDIPLDWNVWTDSDKKKFADYWTEKYGSPYATDSKPKPEENKCYVIETKDDIFVLTGSSVSILKQILQIKNLVSIREAKITNL